MDKWKRELAKKDQSAAKKQKEIPLEVKFDSNVNGIIENHGNVDTASETPDLQPKEVSEGKCIDINKEGF